MARGWESKSVEAQQDEARDTSNHSRARMTPEQAAVFRQKERFRLSRQQVLQQIDAATNPRHRQLLQDALRDLDETLQRLNP